jgi:hypothetical protein
LLQACCCTAQDLQNARIYHCTSLTFEVNCCIAGWPRPPCAQLGC